MTNPDDVKFMVTLPTLLLLVLSFMTIGFGLGVILARIVHG
jgi:hypothetical protein